MTTRRGFSLIELLVVIGIIAVLATLSIIVMQGTVTQARENATAMTITKVSELLEERMSAFDRAATRSVLSQEGRNIDQNVQEFFGVSIALPGRLLRQRTAEIVARKVLFRQFFPQQFAEFIDVQDANGNPGPNGVPDEIEQKTNFDPSRHDPATENAEVLYFVLTQMSVFGVAGAGTDAFNSGEVVDTDGDGLPELIDAWGNPLRFYRWPTRLIDSDALDTDTSTPGVQAAISAGERELATLLIRGLPRTNGITRDPLLVDPDDTIGRIGFEVLRLPALEELYNQGLFHTVDVFHTPLVMSAGADGVLGLLEPTFVDADLNEDGSVDPGEDGNGNGTHDNLFGNLAGVPDGGLDGAVTGLGPSADGVLDDSDIFLVLDSLTDNITNRNRRAGGSN